MLRFDVRLLLPAAQPDTPLVLNTLTTDLPLFDHHLDALGNTVFFDKLQLETQNTPIRVDVSQTPPSAVVLLRAADAAYRHRHSP